MTIVQKRWTGRGPLLNLKTQQIPVPSEYQECKAFWAYALLIPSLGDNLIKNANERISDDGGWFTRALCAIGLRKGLPDYQYIVPNEKYHTLWIEMKRSDQRGKKTRDEQDKWIERLLKNGHYACYAYGCDDAIKIYKDYTENRI